MRTIPMENLTELSHEELTEVQGGGILTSALTAVANLVQGLPNVVSGVGGTLKNLIDFLV
ncbi:Blp family class II bacteriocin [Chitinophaga japonensis]|uniref:Uncharacterized protein n=1 Tax=Chitinophaga japonensis TaxID=104662 RepID=A0A562T6B0_CHIJA|nr:hypothetical protein [Chitinophaga japonensis]TWI89032.1 hypothetical protein LX66_3125 [Chitinophaga japonensis]